MDSAIYTILEQRTELNYSDVAFLFSFGATWLICAAFWKFTSEKTAGNATILQGLIALPIALNVSYLMGRLLKILVASCSHSSPLLLR